MKLVFDIETCGLPNAADFLEPVTADKRLTDPEKIKADIKAKEAARAEKLGLDWNVGRIVAIGWQWEEETESHIFTCIDEDCERSALETFWRMPTPKQYIGFYVRPFDLPYVIQRSRLLGLRHRRVNLAKFRREPVCDLYDELTFDSMRQDGCMKQTLKAFCKRFGVQVPDDDGDGADVAKLVEAGDWEAIEHHLRRDLQRTRGLALKLGYLTGDVPQALATMTAAQEGVA